MTVTARQLLIGSSLAFARNAALGLGCAVYGVLTEYPLFTGQALRFGIAAGALYLVAKLRLGRLPHPSGSDTRTIVLLAGPGLVGFSVCLVLASRYAEPGAIGAVIGCAPLVFALAGPAGERRAPAARLVAVAVLAVLGAVVVERGGDSTALGLLFAGGALVSMTAVALFGASLLPRIPPSAVTLYAAVAAGMLFAALAPLVDGDEFLRAPAPAELAAICYLGLVLSAADLLAWYAAINRIRLERAGLFLAVVPAMALIGGWVVGTGTVTPQQLGGVALVTAALIVELAPAALAVSAREATSTPAPAAPAPPVVANGAVSMRTVGSGGRAGGDAGA